ncbi:MAG: hypothetical protein U1F35_03240 [Steroidobacteraceae bacterium]
MKAEARAAQDRVILDAEEGALQARLAVLLPTIAINGNQLFLNSTNADPSVARYSHSEADTLHAIAGRCVHIRESLGLETVGTLASHFLAACQEASSSNEHRRGPRRLAQWLLTVMHS